MDGIVAIGRNGGERVERPERDHRILGELGEFEVIELCYSPDFEGVGAHTHDDHVDSFYVLEGEVEFTVEGQAIRGGPGTYVAVPQGVVHGFRNAGADRIRVLNIHAPDVGFIERLRR